MDLIEEIKTILISAIINIVAISILKLIGTYDPLSYLFGMTVLAIFSYIKESF